MSKKINLDAHSVTEGIRPGGKKNYLDGLLSGNPYGGSGDQKEIVYISIDELIERPINDFPLEDIPELAKDIKEVGLSQPIIITRGSDISKDSSVAKSFREKGINKNDVTFITSGHRRWHAYKLLHEEEKNDPDRDVLTPYEYDRIPAVYLPAEEAYSNEEQIYLGTNTQQRYIPEFTYCFINRNNLVLSNDTIEKKKEALKRMLGREPKTSDKFSESKYVTWYAVNIGKREGKIGEYEKICRILRQVPTPIQQAISRKEYPISYARETVDLSAEIQFLLYNTYCDDDTEKKERFKAVFQEYVGKKNTKVKKKYTYEDVIKCEERYLKSIDSFLTYIEMCYSDLNNVDKKKADKLKKDIDTFKKSVEESIKQFNE